MVDRGRDQGAVGAGFQPGAQIVFAQVVAADIATEQPWKAPVLPLAAPVPTSFDPCWDQTPPLRVKTHAAPMSPLSSNPPTMAVLPSADRAME